MPQIRVKRVAFASTIGIIVLFTVTGAYPWVMHRYRVWRAGGVYCIPASGEKHILYGDDCL